MPEEFEGSITLRAKARKGCCIDISNDDVVEVVFVLGNSKKGDTAFLRVQHVFYGNMDYVNLIVDGSAGRESRSRSRRNAYIICTKA